MSLSFESKDSCVPKKGKQEQWGERLASFSSRLVVLSLSKPPQGEVPFMRDAGGSDRGAWEKFFQGYKLHKPHQTRKVPSLFMLEEGRAQGNEYHTDLSISLCTQPLPKGGPWAGRSLILAQDGLSCLSRIHTLPKMNSSGLYHVPSSQTIHITGTLPRFLTFSSLESFVIQVRPAPSTLF